MGKVVFINAIISGKVSGQVYARNKGGYYVRGYAKPTDPRTVAQLQARASFSSASGVWHGQTDVSKAQWNGYAISNFNPKEGTPGVLYSGQQAFISLRNTALTGVRLKRTATFTAPAVTGTFASFVPTLVAPIMSFSSSILDSAGKPLPQSLISASLAVSGAFTATIGFDRVTTATSPLWSDAIGQIKSGYIFYASNPLQQAQMFVTNPYLQVVSIVQPPTVTTGWTAVQQFTLSTVAADLPIGQRKIWYTAGDVVQITCFAIGQNGQLARIGSTKVTVI
jgi:hypothetical protein